MKTLKIFLILPVFLLTGITVQSQELKAFKLPNGLSVFIWEDPNATDVQGIVACNVGAKDEPENLTGLAHYLEHVMFKGTEKIGALDWEKEKPIYEQIIAKYDELAMETDAVKKKAINDEINKLTVEAAKYSLTNEFSSLVEGIGGKSLNAATSYDMTFYLNSFPPGEIYKWMELYSERLINPVFRAFQTELETVFEEYNRYQNNTGIQVQEFLFRNIFPNHPYGRPIIGSPEHLKNPRLSQLIQFYNDWYVPENMALILVGNIKTNEVIGMIREKFGRLEKRPSPERKVYPKTSFEGRKEIQSKISPSPEVDLVFDAVPKGSPDQIALEVCVKILSNSSRTGLLDKLTIDGDWLGAYTVYFGLKDQGRIIIGAVPYYDVNQRRYESLGSVEKMILKEIKKLQDGQFEDWLIESVKSAMIREYDLTIEKPANKASALMEGFIYEKDLNTILDYKEIVAGLTTEHIREIAKKYFGKDYLALYMEKGKAPKKTKLEKPKYDPLQPERNTKSDYAKLFELMPVKYAKPQYIDFNEVTVKQVNDRSKLHYTPNNENEVFTLTLKFGIGTQKMPKLELAAYLMDNAGIMGQMKAQEVKQAFSSYGASCRFRVDESYLIITMNGFETYLKESCNLLTRQILLPALDEKQLNSLKGMVYQGRILEKERNEDLSDALNNYLLYKDKSEYIDRLSIEDILNLTISNLTGEFQRATDYEAEIHYSGNLPFDEVYNILSVNLPLKQGEKASLSPEVKEKTKYTENTIYFLPDRDATQSNIYFFVEGDPHDRSNDIFRNAFNQYFSGGFTGLVMQEIREYRSMAYTAYGYMDIPPVSGKKDNFIGYVGTQSDKVLEALDVYTGLLKEMPQYPDRITNIKSFLREVSLSTKPDFRSLSQSIEAWKRRGYTEDPNKTNLEKIEKLTFDDIVNYYNQYIKGRPLAIAIIGDPAQIDTKALEKYGKVVKLSPSKLFSGK